VLAGLLVDLVAGPRPMHMADTVRFPLNPAAHALGVQPALFCQALHHLREARLLTWQTDGTTDAPHITVTLIPPPEPPS
jgi:hypothetical protein